MNARWRRPRLTVMVLFGLFLVSAVLHFSFGLASPAIWRLTAGSGLISALGALGLDRYYRMHDR